VRTIESSRYQDNYTFAYHAVIDIFISKPLGWKAPRLHIGDLVLEGKQKRKDAGERVKIRNPPIPFARYEDKAMVIDC
jgi:hypothetical protein